MNDAQLEAAKAMAALLRQVQRQGCEICGGDCSAAATPVLYCPMTERENALATWDAAQKGSDE